MHVTDLDNAVRNSLSSLTYPTLFSLQSAFRYAFSEDVAPYELTRVTRSVFCKSGKSYSGTQLQLSCMVLCSARSNNVFIFLEMWEWIKVRITALGFTAHYSFVTHLKNKT